MPAPTALMPGQPVPDLKATLIEGADWSLAEENGGNFALIVFYRGYHCPKCKEQLLDIQQHLAQFQDTGTSVIALTMDDEDRARRARDEWGLQNLRIGCGITRQDARNFGLYLSSSRGKTSMGVEELDIFNEPGLFLVRADSTLHAAWVQSVPFARPEAEAVLSAIRFILDKDYPPRGTWLES